jgi:hypothetical protein
MACPRAPSLPGDLATGRRAGAGAGWRQIRAGRRTGDHVWPHIFARPHQREPLRWCFQTVLGCPVAAVDHPGMSEPMLVVRFPGGESLSIEFTVDAPDGDKPRLGAWLEVRAAVPPRCCALCWTRACPRSSTLATRITSWHRASRCLRSGPKAESAPGRLRPGRLGPPWPPATMIRLTVRPGRVITQRHKEVSQPAQRPASARSGSPNTRCLLIAKLARPGDAELPVLALLAACLVLC